MDNENQGTTGNGVVGDAGTQTVNPNPSPESSPTEEKVPATNTEAPVTSAAPAETAETSPAPETPEAATGSATDPAATPVTTEPAVGAVTASAESTQSVMTETPSENKKDKTGVIVGAAAAAVLLLGGGAYAYVHNTPEKVQYDAIMGLINADHLQFAGSVKILPEGDDTSALNSAELEIKEATANLNYDAEATLKVDIEDVGAVSISLGGVFIEDGTIYVRVSNLKDALTTVLEATGEDYDSVDKMTDGLIGEVNGQWWKIAVDEVVDSLDDDVLDKKSKSKVKKGWNCIMETAKSESGKKDSYAKIYKENNFITTTKTSGSLGNHAGVDTAEFEKAGDIYDVNVDADKLANFMNETTKAADTDQLLNCLVDAEILTEDEVESAKENMEEKTVSADDLKDALAELPDVKVAISGWNHNLKGIYVDYGSDSGNMTGAFTVGYDKSKNISAPSDAKSITVLVDKIMKLAGTYASTSGGEIINELEDGNYDIEDLGHDEDEDLHYEEDSDYYDDEDYTEEE